MTEKFYIGQTTGDAQALSQYRNDLMMWAEMRDGALDAPTFLPQGSIRSVKLNNGTFAQTNNTMREGAL